MAGSATPSPSSLIHPSRIPNRWVQLMAGIVAMMAIANLQYAWTLFTKPIQAHLHVSLVAVQWTFTLFVALETWLVPFEGYLVDRIGPRFMLGLGAILVGLGWIGSGYAETINSLYFWYGVGGIGAGIVYGGAIGNALKWFPGPSRSVRRTDCRSFRHRHRDDDRSDCRDAQNGSGYQHTFIVWGIIQGVVVLAASLFLARPPVGWTPPNWKEKEAKIKAKVNTSAVDMTPWQMLRQPSFYVIYVMMTMLAFGGLVVTAQLNPMASSYHVDNVIVAFGMTALVLAITVDRILNGLTRPFWGWVSDNIGRENAIFIAFILEAIAVYALLQLINHPVWFVVLSGLCFFAWGNIFSLFPSITGDLYGKQMGDHQLRNRLHREGRGCGVCRARRRLAVCQDRLLDEGLLGDDCVRSGRGVHGFAMAETSGSRVRKERGANRFGCRYGGTGKSTGCGGSVTWQQR